jgi:hypothetical protein
LADLIKWAERNPSRVHPKVRQLLAQKHEAFWFARRYRDYIVHQGAHTNIFTDRHQFNFNLRGEKGWITQEPLIPLLARHLRHLLEFADAAAKIINDIIVLPEDRIGSRGVNGVLIHALHKLQEVENDYARPWGKTRGT